MAHIKVYDLCTVGQGAAAFLIGQPRIAGERTENRFCIRSAAVIERAEPHPPYYLNLRESIADNRHVLIVYTALIHVERCAALHTGQGSHYGSPIVFYTDLSQINIFRVQCHRFPVEAEAVGKVHIRSCTLKPCNHIPRDRTAFFSA